MVDRVQDRFQVNAGKVGQLVLNCVIVGRTDNPGLPDPKDLQIAIDAIKAVRSETVIELFFERSWPFWDPLSKKEKDVLISSADKMMPEISPKDISIFSLLFTAKKKFEGGESKLIVDATILDSIWSYFHQMVRQCIMYGLTKMGTDNIVTIKSLKLNRNELEKQKAKWDLLKANENKK
jgi:hypothetical protein